MDLKFKSKLGTYDIKCLFHDQKHLWCTVLKSKAFLLFENLGWLGRWNYIWEGKFHICNEIKYCAFQKTTTFNPHLSHTHTSYNTFLSSISRYKSHLYIEIAFHLTVVRRQKMFAFITSSYPRQKNMLPFYISCEWLVRRNTDMQQLCYENIPSII